VCFGAARSRAKDCSGIFFQAWITWWPAAHVSRCYSGWNTS
jgi:hypothetical protein